MFYISLGVCCVGVLKKPLLSIRSKIVSVVWETTFSLKDHSLIKIILNYVYHNKVKCPK